MKDSFKKKVAAIIAALILLCIASGAVYLRKTYVKIEGHICKTDVKEISPNLRYTNIKEINRCTEVEDLMLTLANENDIRSLPQTLTATAVSMLWTLQIFCPIMPIPQLKRKE